MDEVTIKYIYPLFYIDLEEILFLLTYFHFLLDKVHEYL